VVKVSYKQLKEKHLRLLRNLQYQSGLFAASSKGVSTGYDKSWLRDNFYETIPFEIIEDWKIAEKAYNAILQIFLRYEEKIDWAIREKPVESYKYIHARYHPETFDEYWEEWGNKQNDAVGCILFKVGELECRYSRSVLNSKEKIRIINKLVKYLESIEYWHDEDSGMWEIEEEIHASSIGACVAGLESIKKVPGINVPDELIKKGQEALDELLPKESGTKEVDLALLSLIWPYDVVSNDQKIEILGNIERNLLKGRGVMRFKGDKYYSNDKAEHDTEAEWTFGLSWLSIISQLHRDFDQAEMYIKKLIINDTPQGLPELYFSDSSEHNENVPLGWSEALFIVALHNFEQQYGKGLIVPERNLLITH
jgi:hypothetical protein